MEELLGSTSAQFMTLAGIGLVLLVLLFILGYALKLTKALFKFGCLGILVLLIIAFILLQISA